MNRLLTVILVIFFSLNNQPTNSEPTDKKIIINIPSRKLELYEGTKVIKKYPVGVGRPSFPTPTGNFFKIISKVENPKWQNPYKSFSAYVVPSGKGNPLGTRWMGFHKKGKGEYGMHGTNAPASVGKYSSHGCVRMLVKHSEELFELVKMDTPVMINNCTYKVEIEGEKIYIKKLGSAYKTTISPSAMIEKQLKFIGGNYFLLPENLYELDELKPGQKAFVGNFESLQTIQDR